MAWCGGLRVDHGQKHDPGDEILVLRDLTNKGPLQKHYLVLHPDMAASAIGKLVEWFDAGAATDLAFTMAEVETVPEGA